MISNSQFQQSHQNSRQGVRGGGGCHLPVRQVLCSPQAPLSCPEGSHTTVFSVMTENQREQSCIDILFHFQVLHTNI